MYLYAYYFMPNIQIEFWKMSVHTQSARGGCPEAIYNLKQYARSPIIIWPIDYMLVVCGARFLGDYIYIYISIAGSSSGILRWDIRGVLCNTYIIMVTHSCCGEKWAASDYRVMFGLVALLCWPYTDYICSREPPLYAEWYNLPHHRTHYTRE